MPPFLSSFLTRVKSRSSSGVMNFRAAAMISLIVAFLPISLNGTTPFFLAGMGTSFISAMSFYHRATRQCNKMGWCHRTTRRIRPPRRTRRGLPYVHEEPITGPIMDAHTLELLEFAKVRDLVAAQAFSSLGKDLA